MKMSRKQVNLKHYRLMKIKIHNERSRETKMRLDKVRIHLPIVNSRKSKNYALILTDTAGIEHYFNFDGTYDGCAHPPYVDTQTGTSKN